MSFLDAVRGMMGGAGGHLPDNALLQQAFSALRATLGR
jgi:hypothetical protein